MSMTGSFCPKIKMDLADVVGSTGGKPCKFKLDLQSQNVFRRVVSKAESRGMVVRNSVGVALANKFHGLRSIRMRTLEAPGATLPVS